MLKSIIKIFVFLALVPIAVISCSGPAPDMAPENREPRIQPDYSGITIPPNIAPLNFSINENAEKYYAEIRSVKGQKLKINSHRDIIRFNESEWKKLQEENKGEDLFLDVYAKSGPKWTRFKTIVNHISSE